MCGGWAVARGGWQGTAIDRPLIARLRATDGHGKNTYSNLAQPAMIDGSSYLLFVLACIALILVPGPAQALVLAQTLSGGRKAGALSAVGLNIGTLFHTLAAALGISAILAHSALAFSVVKYVGAAYLVWLGIRSLRSPAPAATATAPLPTGSGSSLVQGVTAGVLNPKVALFFLAFLPQFIDAQAPHKTLAFLALGGWFVLQSALFLAALVLLTAQLRHLGRGSATPGRWLNGLGGVLFLGLAAKLARTDLQ
jgi:threonine/homoserine/homoserine lactone efflux protein